MDVYQTDEYRKAKVFQYPAETRTTHTFVGTEAVPRGANMKEVEQKQYERILFMNPSLISFGRETVDLIVAFALLFWGISFYGIFTGTETLVDAMAFGLAVAPAFILHELGHKYMAMNYGRYARFAMIKNFALLTFMMGFFPFFIGTPGATMILGRPPSKRENGLFSIAGPGVNFALAILFMLLLPLAANGPSFVYIFVDVSIFVNIILGLFNLLPIAIIDGKKIWNWSRPIWVACVLAFIFLFITYLPNSAYLNSV